MPCRQSKLVTDTLELARRMIILADDAESEDVDDGCVLLCGVLRDCAYQVKRQAEVEKKLMQAGSRWAGVGDTTPSAVAGRT